MLCFSHIRRAAFALVAGMLLGASHAGVPELLEIPPDPDDLPSTATVKSMPTAAPMVEIWLRERIGRMGDFEFSILGGRPGYPTPVGAFQVEWRNRLHLSRQWNNAPMPYSVFFRGGAAIHEGSLGVMSHGCVHVAEGAARKIFFAVKEKDTKVYVYP